MVNLNKIIGKMSDISLLSTQKLEKNEPDVYVSLFSTIGLVGHRGSSD